MALSNNPVSALVALNRFAFGTRGGVGRTARVNGTVGTDHGTGTVAFLAGGAVKGGRVIADWLGLKGANLYENRGLMPTTDIRSGLKGLLADQFGISDAILAEKIFADSSSVKPMRGLIA
jgi:uncharacterized protein (DUF1501 family)